MMSLRLFADNCVPMLAGESKRDVTTYSFDGFRQVYCTPCQDKHE